MNRTDKILANISLVTANFGSAVVFADILQDWFEFLGGKPGEVVVIDSGSDIDTHKIYWQLFEKGLIDKLQIIQRDHEDNFAGKESCYIQEYTSGAVASKKYLCFFKADTLPYRSGNEDWLKESISYLDRDDVYAVSGSWSLPAKHHDAFPGWYFSDKCSLNFALMKRISFMEAMQEYASSYIISGFKAENPALKAGRKGRMLVEIAFEEYIKRHKKYTLSKIEDEDWTVFHTNTNGKVLQKVRNKYLARQGVKPFMNRGLSETIPKPYEARYYGQPIGFFKKIRIKFGQSVMGIYWRLMKRKIIS